MINKNSLSSTNQFFLGLKNSFKKIYQNSNFYNKKISKVNNNKFEYKPSPYLLSSIIKYQKKNIKLKTLPWSLFGKIIFNLQIMKN